MITLIMDCACVSYFIMHFANFVRCCCLASFSKKLHRVLHWKLLT